MSPNSKPNSNKKVVHVPKVEPPAHHPLKLMQDVAAEPLAKTVARLTADGGITPEVPLDQALRACILQAYYSISDFHQFADHLRFNSSYRWFVGLVDDKTIWDTSSYAQLIRRLIEDQELKHFFTLITRAARLKNAFGYWRIASILEHWVGDNCPAPVYFQDYSKSPVKEVTFTIKTRSGYPSYPQDIFSKEVQLVFPVKDVICHMPENPNDYVFYPEFSTEDEQYRVTTDTRDVRLRCRSQYKTWEESVRPYVETTVNACQSTCPSAKIECLTLGFSNVLTFPSHADLSDYFRVVPAPVPSAIAPKIMRENGFSYALPKQVVAGTYETNLAHDDGIRWLGYYFKFHTVEKQLRITLDIVASWDPAAAQILSTDQLLAIVDQLKQDIYIAFHSIITDRTRARFE